MYFLQYFGNSFDVAQADSWSTTKMLELFSLSDVFEGNVSTFHTVENGEFYYHGFSKKISWK